jgi:hypothetical protein
MIFDMVGMIFDVITQMFLYVFGISFGSGVTYGGVIIVSSLVFGIANVVLAQFLEEPNDRGKVKSIKSSTKRSHDQIRDSYNNWAVKNGQKQKGDFD